MEFAIGLVTAKAADCCICGLVSNNPSVKNLGIWIIEKYVITL